MEQTRLGGHREGTSGTSWWRSFAALIVGLTLMAACGPQQVQTSPANGAVRPDSRQPTAPSGTLKIAWSTEPESLNSKLIGTGAGMHQYHWVFNSFLTYTDADAVTRPMLAREIPTQANGDWVINTDGTMVTTYRLRENARWHDGAPITAHDFVFGYDVYRDPDVPARERLPETLMSNVEARDDHTLVITWQQPFVTANRLTAPQLEPLPRHILEDRYRTNRANFVYGEEWTASYIGSGPFRVERWTPGVGVIARAHLDWVFGPPKLQTLDIRFVTDPRAQLANLLSGEVDLINGPGISPADAAVARDQWVARGEGYLRSWHRTIRFLSFQFREVPNWQRAIADLRVRQALMHATDRASMVEVLTHGLGLPAYAFVFPSDPIARQVEPALTTYPYDPNRAAALLSEAGWRRPGAASLVTGPAGESMGLEIWTTGGGNSEQEVAILADAWRSVGIDAGIYLIPAARQRDLELRTSFPAVNLTSRFTTLDDFVFTSTNLPTPEARWQGANRGSFRDAEVDRLYNLAVGSLDDAERQQSIIALHKRMSEALGAGPLYYDGDYLFAKHKLKGPIGETAYAGGVSWNVFEWEVSDP